MIKLFPTLLSTVVALLIMPSHVTAMPTVLGNQVSWSDSGWHQVQRADTFETLCEGNDSSASSLMGGPCIIDSGVFIVINHTTGERFENISASGATPSISSVVLEGNQLSWPNDGWYQLQDTSNYETVCEGVQTCTIGDGTYVLINHTSGERFENIRIGESTATGRPDDEEASDPISTIQVTNNTIRWSDDGWYQVQDTSSYTSVCEGGTECDVSPGNYVVINHTSGERHEITVVGEDAHAPANDLVLVDLDIFVPAHVSNELLVSVEVSWNDQQVNASWEFDEYWFANVEVPADETHLFTVTFYDRNGEITLGSYQQMYRPEHVHPDDLLDLLTIEAYEFYTDLWDDDADGISNIDELRRGSDPLLAGTPSSYTSFDFPAVANDLTLSLAGYQLDQFSAVVDDLAFLTTQQRTITWPTSAYYQVQHAYRFTNLCEGGPDCKLVPGSYLVINHATNERELLDIPYIDPAELSNYITVADATFTLSDPSFETDTVDVLARQYQCEHSGSMTTERVEQDVDTHLPGNQYIKRVGYRFDNCRMTVRDSLIPNGIYVINGSMHEDDRTYGGAANNTDSYLYDGFSLVGENGLEYRISGTTQQTVNPSSIYIVNRFASITEFKKVGIDGHVKHWIQNSDYRSESEGFISYWLYELELNGRLLSEDTANQWVSVNTSSPLMQRWHSIHYHSDEPAIRFQGSYQMLAQDGSSFTTTAIPCFVDADGIDCVENRRLYVNLDHVAASGERTQTTGVRLDPESFRILAPVCETGGLIRTHINPGAPYVDAHDEGRLECTSGTRWHTDLYGRYTYGSVILPERSIVIP